MIVAFSLVLLRSYHLGIFGICVCRLREVVFLSMNGEVNVFPSRGGETGPRKEERSGWYISRVFHVHCG